MLGSALDLQRDMLGTLEAARREHGDVVRFVAGPPRLRSELYAVFHPDGVRRVLAAEADRYRKDNRFYQEVRWALGDGLLNSQDERWLRQRRFVQPLFTRKRIAGYADSMARRGRRPRQALGALGDGRRPPRDVADHAAGRRAACCSAPTSSAPCRSSAPRSRSSATTCAGAR